MGKVVSQTFSIFYTLFVIVMVPLNLLSCHAVTNNHPPQQTQSSETTIQSNECNVSFGVPETSPRTIEVSTSAANPEQEVATTMSRRLPHINYQMLVRFRPYQNRHYIPVILDDSIQPSERTEIVEAMREWNRILGRRILRLERERTRRDHGSFFVTKKDLSHDQQACNGQVFYAFTLRWFSTESRPEQNHAEIQINTAARSPSLYKVMVHEFGHAFGLVHDQNRESIMYGYLLATDWLIEPEDVQFVQRVIERIPQD